MNFPSVPYDMPVSPNVCLPIVARAIRPAQGRAGPGAGQNQGQGSRGVHAQALLV